MQEEVLKTALAGLLHDIGKFAQRAGWRRGKHAQVGGEFVGQYVPAQWKGYLYPVMGHHDKPLQGCETKVVALADRLSAGERASEEGKQPRQLLSIFCRLEADGQQLPKEQYRYWPLKSLTLRDDVLFPQEPWDKLQIESAYDDLWKGFTAEVEALCRAHAGNGDLPVYLENLLLLMQRYTWCVPSAYYRSLPDVSLYDHSRTTAALAVCLSGRPEPWLDAVLSAPERSNESVASLIGGDISGVQDFIYTITSRGATSALRGRSFYLQLLTEAVVRFMLREMQLPIPNLIYQGGGHFYLLASPTDADELMEIQQKVSRVLLAHHRGDLYLALDQVPLAAVDFYDGRISDKWDDLAQRLRTVKQRRFAELGDDIKTLFIPQGHGGNQDKQCQVCGREHPKTRKDKKAGDGVRKCPPCFSYEKLGDSLRQANYLWFEKRDTKIPKKPLEIEPGGWQEVLAAFGLHGGISKEPPQGGSITHHLVLALNDDALKALSPAAHVAVGRRFLVNVTPIITQEEVDTLRDKVEDLPKAGSVKPFSAMEAQSQGIKRLGVLRMDVDNLGTLFNKGFGQHATLSRVAALSFAISLYFEGWVGQIARGLNAEAKQNGRGEVLYSIYSGGDDLFFVGAWDAVIELARRVRADMTPFAAHHPGIHASAGMVLVGGKYPLYQAAQDAGEAEGRAKSLRWRDDKQQVERTKDAITFLNRPAPWVRVGLETCDEVKLDTAHALAHRLVRMVKPADEGGEGAPQALLRRLIQLQEMYEEAAKERRKLGEELNQDKYEQVYWGPWMWRGHYSLIRMAGKKKGEPWDTIRALAESLKGDRFRAIEWIGLAARWADLLTR